MLIFKLIRRFAQFTNVKKKIIDCLRCMAFNIRKPIYYLSKFTKYMLKIYLYELLDIENMINGCMPQMQ